MHGNWAISRNTDDKKIDWSSPSSAIFNRTYSRLELSFNPKLYILFMLYILYYGDNFFMRGYCSGLAWRCDTVGLKTIPLGLETMLGLKTHRLNAMGYSLIPLGLNVSGVVLNVWVFRPSNLAWTSGLHLFLPPASNALISWQRHKRTHGELSSSRNSRTRNGLVSQAQRVALLSRLEST